MCYLCDVISCLIFCLFPFFTRVMEQGFTAVFTRLEVPLQSVKSGPCHHDKMRVMWLARIYR